MLNTGSEIDINKSAEAFIAVFGSIDILFSDVCVYNFVYIFIMCAFVFMYASKAEIPWVQISKFGL